MKTRTKIGIGLSIAAISGIYASVSLSEEILKKLKQEKTRYKTKKIVKDKFAGNEALLTLVDNLSDRELETINQIAKKISETKITKR